MRCGRLGGREGSGFWRNDEKGRSVAAWRDWVDGRHGRIEEEMERRLVAFPLADEGEK